MFIELVAVSRPCPVRATVGARQGDQSPRRDRPAYSAHLSWTTPTTVSPVCIWDHALDHQPPPDEGPNSQGHRAPDTSTSAHTGLTYTHAVTDHIELMRPEIH